LHHTHFFFFEKSFLNAVRSGFFFENLLILSGS
jgi:hypothetical protein